MPEVVERLFDLFLGYAVRFGIVGLAGYAIDVGIFNALRLGFLGNDHFFQDPIGAKIASVTIATLATWFGNRYWTFRENRRKNFMLELLEFCAIALVGMGISLLCLYVSHYVMGYTSLLADNISTNVVGLILATAFRFLMYRFWVYGDHRSDGLAARKAAAQSETVPTLPPIG
jgi:putative flippase GtrA